LQLYIECTLHADTGRERWLHLSLKDEEFNGSSSDGRGIHSVSANLILMSPVNIVV
jgi:hypothetical protein